MNYIDQLLKKVNDGKITRKEMCLKLTTKYRNRTVWDLFNDVDECGEEIHFDKVTPSDSNEDVKDLLYDFMTRHTYDNGLPLTGVNYPPEDPDEEHDYFEHYDRDQDFGGTGMDEDILEIDYDENENEWIVRVDVTKEGFESDWEDTYQGSSYEHDFG